MLKKILSHWHYGIKARVVDGALLVKFDTAVEPTLLRLELARVQANTLSVRAVDGDYELGLAGYKMEFVPLAKFEAREAAETAQHCIERAMFCGARTRRFKGALAATLGVGVGFVLSMLIVFTVLSGMLGGSAAQLMRTPNTPVAMGAGTEGLTPDMAQAIQMMQAGGGMPASITSAAPAPKTESGVPMSADDFLSQTGAGQ